jgi:hypothetical protein
VPFTVTQGVNTLFQSAARRGKKEEGEEGTGLHPGAAHVHRHTSATAVTFPAEVIFVLFPSADSTPPITACPVTHVQPDELT